MPEQEKLQRRALRPQARKVKVGDFVRICASRELAIVIETQKEDRVPIYCLALASKEQARLGRTMFTLLLDDEEEDSGAQGDGD